MQLALRKLLCASCCKMQVASCDARPRTREESNPRPAGSGSRRANHETTPEDQFEQQKSQKTLSFCTSTTPIPAEGCARTAEIAKYHGFLHLDHADPRRGSREQVRNRKNHGFLHLDHADPRRGSREHRRNRKKPWVFAPRPRRSPQSREQDRNRKKPWAFAPRPRRSLQGHASRLEIAKNHGLLHLDHADPRRGSREQDRNRKKPWVFAPPQRVDFRVVSSALPRRPKKRF